MGIKQRLEFIQFGQCITLAAFGSVFSSLAFGLHMRSLYVSF